MPETRAPLRAEHLADRAILAIGLVLSMIGFGWLLLAMGITQAPKASTRIRLLYVIVFALLPLYNLPFAKLLE